MKRFDNQDKAVVLGVVIAVLSAFASCAPASAGMRQTDPTEYITARDMPNGVTCYLYAGPGNARALSCVKTR